MASTDSARNEVRPIVWTDDKVARLWNYYATVPAIQDLYFSRVYGEAILRKASLGLMQSLRVLDFGAGNGDLWNHARRLGAAWRYSALEFSMESAKLLRERFRNDPQFTEAILSTGFPLEVPAASFDIVMMVEVVEHLSDEHLSASLVEAARVLGTGGALLVTTPHNEDLSIEAQYCPDCGCVFHRWQHQRTWTTESLRSTVEAYGFTLDRLWVGHWDDARWYGWLYNRIAARLRGRRVDPHMMAVFRRR